MPAHAAQIYTDVQDPTQSFVVVDIIAVQNPAPYAAVLWPNGGEAFLPGQEVSIRWETAGMGTDFVNIWFTPDAGATYELVAWQIPSQGSYFWRLPDEVTREAMFTVEATDLVDIVASDDSDGAFNITPLPAEGVSPITGETESLNAVVPGDIIGSESYDEGWYVDETMSRRPILDVDTALTYLLVDETPVVAEVSDATLVALPLKHALVPNPGTVLVKFADAAPVYAVEGIPEVAFLRHIVNEAVATLNYGETWNEYVLEVSPILRGSYNVGSDIVSNIYPDTSGMLKSADIVALADEIERLSEEAEA